LRLVTHNTDPVAPLRIGLHIDDWDKLPPSRRSRGRRRLCANLGMRPRYLVFLQSTVSRLAASGELPDEIPEDAHLPAMVRGYLGCHLNQLAARVRIDPGEAYVVNADDVIHDGASDSCEAPDVALHFQGYFNPAIGAARQR
jgi:hypothetical protein